MDEQEFAKIIELITQRTGIIPRDSHITGIKNYISKRLKELKEEDALNYYDFLSGNRDELLSLINSATVNETYFFREEAQFKLHIYFFFIIFFALCIFFGYFGVFDFLKKFL